MPRLILNFMVNTIKHMAMFPEFKTGKLERPLMIHSSGRLFSTVSLAFLLFFTGYQSLSAQSSAAEKKWNFLTDVYLMFPYMDGETGIGESLILPVDASPGDIFSKLKMGAMLYLEANTDKWAITSDLVYMNLNQEVTPGTIVNSGNVTAKQLIWEAAGLYRITPFLEAGVGGRLNYLETGVDVRRNVFPAGTEEVTGQESKTWYDPVVIARLTADIHDKWLFQFRGDIGGFGIGSDLTWQLHATAGYRFTKLFQMSLGYRILSTDYKTGEEPKEFLFDVSEFGPEIRFGFNF
jgi:hypothetical protein